MIGMKVVIKETGIAETLRLTDKNGYDYVQDFIGNNGALNDGQFVYDDEKDAYLVSSDDYEWWSNTIQLHQQLNDKIAELSDEHGSDAVHDVINGVNYLDLDDEAKAMLAALEKAFG